MLTIVCFEELWVNKASVRFLQLDPRNRIKQVQLIRYGTNGLTLLPRVGDQRKFPTVGGSSLKIDRHGQWLSL